MILIQKYLSLTLEEQEYDNFDYNKSNIRPMFGRTICLFI